MENMSKILSNREISSIVRIGDLMIPAYEEFPSFSQLGCVEHIDSVLGYAPEDDIKDLKLLLKSLSLLPDKAISGLVKIIAENKSFPEKIAGTLRLMDTGLRGIVFTLYYSGKTGKNYQGKTPLEIIDYSIIRIPL